MSYLSTLSRNFLHSGSHFHCLHTLLSFPYATQGSFVFLLIFSTAFVPSQRCAVALTPNAPHCPHQGLHSATTEPPFKLYRLCFQSSMDHFSAPFTALSRFTSLLLIGPDDTSLQFQFASSCRSRCSPFSSFCSHEA